MEAFFWIIRKLKKKIRKGVMFSLYDSRLLNAKRLSNT